MKELKMVNELIRCYVTVTVTLLGGVEGEKEGGRGGTFNFCICEKNCQVCRV